MPKDHPTFEKAPNMVGGEGECKRNFPIGKKKSKRKQIPEISTSQRGERNFQDDSKQRLNKGES